MVDKGKALFSQIEKQIEDFKIIDNLRNNKIANISQVDLFLE